MKGKNRNKKPPLNLENELSALKLQLEDLETRYQAEKAKRRFYQTIADFAHAWELWLEPDGTIKYCSPSCYDLSGYTSNEIIKTQHLEEMLVYGPDKGKFKHFLTGALRQSLLSQSLEFRMLTRTKQLCWCNMDVKGVYDQLGKYLGIRASVYDISRLKRAMGHITELQRGNEYEKRNKQRLQNQLDLKDRELVSFLLQLSQKNEVLAKMGNALEEAPKVPATGLHALMEQMRALLQQHNRQPVNWNAVELQIEQIHPGFFGRLQKQHPTISENDKKLCAYVRLGLSSKEIAGLLGIVPKSVEIARVRLRKKLKIASKIRLSQYILQF